MPKNLSETASGKVSYLTNLLPLWEKEANRCQHHISLTTSAFSKKDFSFSASEYLHQSINQLDEARNTQKNNQRTIYKKAGSSLKASVKKEKNVKKNINCISYKSRTWPKTWCWNVLFLVSSLLPGVVFWREKKRIWSMVIHDTFNSFLNFSWPLSK